VEAVHDKQNLRLEGQAARKTAFKKKTAFRCE
jgi:hypothetical protein